MNFSEAEWSFAMSFLKLEAEERPARRRGTLLTLVASTSLNAIVGFRGLWLDWTGELTIARADRSD